jgi:Protein of unknown function (DUF3108)
MAIPESVARTSNRVRRWKHPLALSLCVFVVIASQLDAASQASKQTNQKSKKSAKPAAAPAIPPTPPPPFKTGEILSFSGEWLKMSGAITAQLKVVEQRAFFGHPAWHFQGHMQTNNPLKIILPVDDQFDSYDGLGTLLGLQFEMYLHESGKSETHLLRLSSGIDPAPPAGTTVVKVLPDTRDPVGFTYFLRTVDWAKTPEVRGPVYDGHKLYEVRATVATPRADISVAAGKFAATGISARLFSQGTEMTTSKITLWIAQDAAHTPILLEMELPIGTGRVELIRVSAGGS